MIYASDMSQINTIKSELATGWSGEAETLLESQSFQLLCHFKFCEEFVGRQKGAWKCFVIVSLLPIV